MENIQFNGASFDSSQLNKNLDKIENSNNFNNINNSSNFSDKITLLSNFSLLSELHKLILLYSKITHPVSNLALSFVLLNPNYTYNLFKQNLIMMYNTGSMMSRSLLAIVNRQAQPCKKSWEINYISENLINHLYIALDWYLKTNSKIKKFENHIVVSLTKPIEATKLDKDYKISQSIPEMLETEFTYDNVVFYYSKTSNDTTIYAPSGEMKKKNYKLSIWSYHSKTDTFDNLCKHVVNLYGKSKVNDVWTQKLYNHDNGMWKEESIGRNKRKISSVVMKNNKNLEIAESLRHFIETEDWHLDRGITYKRSYLLYGPPGGGKSSMIKAMSYETQRHIHYINLANIKNDQMFNNLMSKIDLKETILVIEDIDCQTKMVWDRKFLVEPDTKEEPDTKDKVETSTLTFSTLLNFIDGVHNNHAMIAIITTNFPERLDKALTREGRIDEKIFFDYCDHDHIYKMFTNFYNIENNITLDEINSTLDLSKNKIAPCKVENAMKKNFNNAKNALLSLCNVNDAYEKYEM